MPLAPPSPFLSSLPATATTTSSATPPPPPLALSYPPTPPAMPQIKLTGRQLT